MWVFLSFFALTTSLSSDPPNIALDAPVINYFSGTPQNVTSGPSNAAPGWVTTSFITTPDHTLFPEFITLDLGPQCFNLTSVVLTRPASPQSCGFPTNFTLSLSDNQQTAWRLGYAGSLLPPPPPGGNVTLDLPPTSQGRYLRLAVTAVSPPCPGNGSVWLSVGRVLAMGSPTPCPPPSDPSWLPTPWPPTCTPSVASFGVEGQAIFSSPGHPLSSTGAAIADSGSPLFTFALGACERGQRPTAFYLRVGTTPGGVELWDSGKVGFLPGGLTNSARYSGAPLPPSSRIYASLALFDINGMATPTTPQDLFFLTAKLNSNFSAPGVWEGAWLGTGVAGPGGSGTHRAVYLRSSFSLPTPTPPLTPAGLSVVSAVATFSLLGYGELYINGGKVGDALLAPGWTQYNKRTQYLTVDVTGALQGAPPGQPIALGVILGDGWYSISADCWVHHLQDAVYVSTPKALVDITVTFSDGSRRVYGTSTTTTNSSIATSGGGGGDGGGGSGSPWVWSYGGISRAWIGAEDIDDNAALPNNWTLGGTPSVGGGWAAAVAVPGPPQQFPGALLVSQVEAPTRAQELVPWQTHTVSTISPTPTPYIGGGRFEMNSTHSTMVFWVPDTGALKYQLNPGACSPCPSIDACRSVVEVPQQALDARTLAPTNFSCSLLPTRGGGGGNATSHVFFFGREFQGWVRVRVNISTSTGSAGSTSTGTSLCSSPLNLTILVCGSMDGVCDGSTTPNELGGPDASHYTPAVGACSGVWEPRFMYSSVRTVVVTLRGGESAAAAAAGAATLEVVGVRVAMDAPPMSSFSSSDDRYDWMHHAVARTQENYITAFPNDPTREKKGWTQDIMTMGPAALLLHGSAQRMYERWVWDITDNQAPSGQLPEVAPGPVLDDGYNGAWWGGMGVFGPWMLYSFTGDLSHLARHYPAMRAYTLFLNASATPNGSYDIPWGLGDWLSLLPQCAHDSPGINTPALAFYADTLAQSAALLGEAGDAALFSTLSTAVSTAYLARRLNATSGEIGPGFQCNQALALGLYPGFLPPTPPTLRAALEGALLGRIASDGTTLTTGFVTFTRMLQVLGDLSPGVGQGILLQRTGAGPWGTTAGSSNDLCKEQWDGVGAQMPSLCGPLALWSFSALAGVRLPSFLAPAASSSPPQYPPASAVAFATLAIKPPPADPVGGGVQGLQGLLLLRWVNASLTLPSGVVRVAWFLDDSATTATHSSSSSSSSSSSIKNNSSNTAVHAQQQQQQQHLKLLVVLPPGTTAVVHFPAQGGSVTESGRPVGDAQGVQVLGQFGLFFLLRVDSGAYAFEGTPI